MSSTATYILNGDTTGNINAAANAGWVQLPRQGGGSCGFQVALASTGSPVGTFVFEITDDENPLVAVGVILGATALTLSAAQQAAQPTSGAAVNFLFEFNPAPTAKWIRMRYARTSGGSAAAGSLNVGFAMRTNH